MNQNTSESNLGFTIAREVERLGESIASRVSKDTPVIAVNYSSLGTHYYIVFYVFLDLCINSLLIRNKYCMEIWSKLFNINSKLALWKLYDNYLRKTYLFFDFDKMWWILLNLKYWQYISVFKIWKRVMEIWTLPSKALHLRVILKAKTA